jgi:N-acetyltransferase
MQVKRTYGSRSYNGTTSTSLPKPTTNSTIQAKRKRPLTDVLTPSSQNIPTPFKRQKLSATKSKSNLTASKLKQKPLTQLHFAIDQTVFRTCPLCGLSYTKGAPEDENLHRAQCARVQRGMEWGREEERESTKAGVVEVASQVKIADGRRGRIISCSAECTGKIGSKVCARSSLFLFYWYRNVLTLCPLR